MVTVTSLKNASKREQRLRDQREIDLVLKKRKGIIFILDLDVKKPLMLWIMDNDWKRNL